MCCLLLLVNRGDSSTCGPVAALMKLFSNLNSDASCCALVSFQSSWLYLIWIFRCAASALLEKGRLSNLDLHAKSTPLLQAAGTAHNLLKTKRDKN
jgi:hypothetical protein